MTPEEIMERSSGAYLCLIRPILQDNAYRHEISPILAIVPQIGNADITEMIVGSSWSWRERLIGLVLAMVTQPDKFAKPVLQSLQNPRGIAIVPACAFLSVLAERNIFKIETTLFNDFDRNVFDGELGWAIDKVMFNAHLQTNEILGRGPNYGQIFEDHLEVYRWLIDNKSSK